MDFICFGMLILFVFHVEKTSESNTDDIAAFTGCNVSLKWTLRNILKEADAFDIYNSFGNKTASYSESHDCLVRDNSSTSCKTNASDDVLIIWLTIFNVTERQSGMYTFRQTFPLERHLSISTNLSIIGKPKVIAAQKPIFGQRFEMTCNSSYGQECYIYRWRKNGTVISSVHNVNSHYISSLHITDNFSSFTCQVCLKETANSFPSVICEHDRCSADSDPYTIQVPHGPDNISLSSRERTFYLKEHEIFEIDCSANCYPNCIFWWKGPSDIPSKKLNISFELRMSGQYTCLVTNQETNSTIISDPITLHHAEDDDKEENMRVIGMGLVGVSVLLVVVGCLLLWQWRKNASNKTDSKSPNELVMNLRTLTNGDTSQGTSRIQNRALPGPNTHDATRGGHYRPKYPNHNRKSRSLHNLLDSVQDSFHPLRSDLSLQVLYSPSNIMRRCLRNGNQGYNPINGKCFSSSSCEENQLGDMSVLENGIKLEFLYAKGLKDRETGAQSGKLNNLQNESFEEEPQENPYSTIDEDALSVFDDAINNNTSENSNDEQMNDRHEESENDCTNLPVYKYKI